MKVCSELVIFVCSVWILVLCVPSGKSVHITELNPLGKERKRNEKLFAKIFIFIKAKLFSQVHFHPGNKCLLQTPKPPGVTAVLCGKHLGTVAKFLRKYVKDLCRQNLCQDPPTLTGRNFSPISNLTLPLAV